ncbi:proline--tRNA ligase [Eubacterium brachy ATCC 33089]|nr:proline--tRNA ligase [Eubacterium brachy ATCC 33089]
MKKYDKQSIHESRKRDYTMRLSKMHLKTLREVPNEAELASHILLLRGGMIRKLASGIYGYMPLGWRSIRKIENIIREEMDKSGSQEVLMSAIQPAELWQESKRWFAYGPEMWRVKDRHEREFCLGPTHEEVFTDIVRNEISSHRQLPVNLYQIQTKYRDEARPRFGLMRSREFIMKDAYSFDKDEEGLDESYKEMYETYERIFTRCGLTFRAVEADTGAIGGSNSHEFTAISEVGESEITYCNACKMAATTEKAEVADECSEEDVKEIPLEKIYTPNTKTITEVAQYLDIDEKKTIKALLFVTHDDQGEKSGYAIAFIRGDRELNEVKLINALGIHEHQIEFADEAEIADATGAVGGFTGPIGLVNCTVVIDSELTKLKNLCAGANEKNYHIKNVNYGRDYKGDIIADIKTLKANDPCPKCGAPVKHARGIEVGQVFKLGTKYSDSMGAVYKDENQKDKPIVMGSYGIGVSRTLAAIIEQNHDENGIIWPMPVAPYEVMITVVKVKDDVQMELAEKMYDELVEAGIEVLLDDRDERVGVKFKDADLLGVPIRITVGKGATNKLVEYKLRRDVEKVELHMEEAIEKAKKTVLKER